MSRAYTVVRDPDGHAPKTSLARGAVGANTFHTPIKALL
jgi:hypothetical protein